MERMRYGSVLVLPFLDTNNTEDCLTHLRQVLMGHFIVGSTRLVGALIRCMVMACSLTIGWQFTGYNLMKDQISDDIPAGVHASFVPQVRESLSVTINLAP